MSIAILLPLVVGLRASAQAVANAQIHGTVRDGSGAVVPNAQIKATQVATGRVQTTVSGADGTYSLPNLPVGSYSLTVTAPSFRTYTQSGIELQVGNNVQVNVRCNWAACPRKCTSRPMLRWCKRRTLRFPRSSTRGASSICLSTDARQRT